MQRIWSTLLSAAVLATTAPAQEFLSLPELLAEALQHSPEIRRAAHVWEAAQAQAPQESALSDPMLQVGFERNPVFVREIVEGHQLTEPGMDAPLERMNMLSISLAQEFPYPGKRRLRRQVAEKNAETEAARLDETRNALAALVKRAYWDLALAGQSRETVAQSRSLLREFEATARARYRVGEGSQQDLLKAQVEMSALLQRLAVLDQQREAATAQLNGLLNRPPADTLGQPAPLPPPRALPALEALYGQAREHNPMLHRQRRAAEAAQLQVALMEKEYRPDFTLSAGWKTDGGLDDFFQVMVETPLPLQRQRRHSGVHQARAELEAARQEYLAAEQLLLAQIRDLASQVAAGKRLVELYQQALIPQARFSLEAALAGYRVGQVELLMLLDNARALLEDELMVQDQLAAHHRALAQLEEALGAPLEP
jgi:outer membrane protein TolC